MTQLIIIFIFISTFYLKRLHNFYFIFSFKNSNLIYFTQELKI